MSRLPGFVIGVLAAATVGAFFVVQHLKTTTPLIAGFPHPSPATFNPIYGVTCGSTNYRRMQISFYLLHRSDDVDVDVINQSGDIVATLASDVHMVGRWPPVFRTFTWDGRLEDGSIAPDGTYFIKVFLRNQGREFVISPVSGGPPSPVRVDTLAPQPVVTSVSPFLVPYQGSMKVLIRYAGNEGRPGTIRIYRTDVRGRPQLVKSFVTPGHGQSVVWDGRILGEPAPAGVYLVGIDVTDGACNTGHWPIRMPPAPGSTPHDGVTVRYLAADPPLTPIRAGSSALVLVDSRRNVYGWALRRAGSSKVLERAASTSSVGLSVHLPGGASGLYELSLRYGANTTTVPLVASGSRRAKVLVVLPALTWQGLNPVDETGDGLPSTLTAGGPVSISRPLAHGLPPGFGEEAALIEYLIRTRRAFDLTTDLALYYGIGPSLSGHRGVILDGAEQWIPATLAGQLRTFALQGGNLLSFGRDSLRAYVQISGGEARRPGPESRTDIFGVKHGPFVASNPGIVGAFADSLGVFSGTSGLLRGYSAYEPIVGVISPARLVTRAGTSPTRTGLAGVQLGRGTVVEVGLKGFIARLVAGDPDTHDVFDSMWSVLGGQ